MFGFSSGFNATPADSAFSLMTPVTADCFLPPRTVYPRAWQRVAVAPVPGAHRQRKIWKRVGGVSPVPVNSDYVRAMTELARDGQGTRKRQRQHGHIPVWGDAKWDPKVEERRDGKWDLIEARAAISIVKKNPAAAAITTNDKTRPTTFPEERLKWVPKKRHNSRWPIEPKEEKATRMVADMQPLIDFDMPPSPEPVDVTLRLDEKQMRRRSTRRLSRRFSLFPGEDSPRKLPMVSLSPGKISAPMLSPVKRPPVALSPTKVVDSPHRSFRINATPTKVVLESPKSSPSAVSPSKPSSSPVAPIHDTVPSPFKTPKRVSSAQTPASPAPLMFDQPTPEAPVEAQHETRRRISLQSARRTDRGSSGASRLLALKAGRNSPNRRHSFTSVDIMADDVRGSSKGRRNTLDVFCVGPEQLRDGPGGTNAAAHDGVPEEVVEVDMKTSLDIFGQPSKAAEPTPQNLTEGSEGAEMAAESESPATSSSAAASPTKDSPVPRDVILSSPSTPKSVVSEGTEAEVGAGGACPDQAATSPNATESEVHRKDLALDSSPLQVAIAEMADIEAEDEESEMLFEPYEPDGLSTIYEESTIVETEASGSDRTKPASQTSTLASSTQSSFDEQQESTNDLDQSPATPRSVSSEPEADGPAPLSPTAQLLADEQLAKETCGLGDVSTDHVATASDAMSPSDSPQPDRGTCANIAQPQAQEQAEAKASPITIEESVITPSTDNDLFGTASPRQETNDSSTITGESSATMPRSEVPAGVEEDVSTPDQSEALAPVVPATPTQTGTKLERIITPEAGVTAAQPESSGFTPINTRQISPTQVASSIVEDQAVVAEHDSDSDLDADEVIEGEVAVDMDDEAAAAIDEDGGDEDGAMDVEVGHRVKNDTLQLQGLNDDSETEMLRQFVTRVTADKNAKAAAAAAALANKSTRPKRRSSSTGSISSLTGSPIAKAELETSAANRRPLGEKSPNSPSPTKKRKLEEVDDAPAKDKDTASHDDAAENPIDGPRLKRRRKRVDPVLETPAAASVTPSPEPESGPRRSTRARNTRVALRPAAPSANSVALSMIPVRMPGMGAMDDAALDAHLAAMAARQRSAEKDLAAVTRGNTRKNKAGAVPPQVMLARQAEDPSWDMGAPPKGGKAEMERRAWKKAREEKSKGKGVKWAEELVQFQSGGSVYEGLARELLRDVEMGEPDDGHDDGVDEIAEAPPTVEAPVAVEKKKVVVAAKKSTPATSAKSSSSASTRRSTRSSRLQAPAPVKKTPVPSTATTASAPAPRSRTKALPKPKLMSAPAPTPAAAPPAPVASSSSTPAASTSSQPGMSTRRTRVSKLGMSGNGTPAPKRRGRTAV